MTEPAKAPAGEAVAGAKNELFLVWRRTWLDKENHFSAFPRTYGNEAGRIYRHSQTGQWFWSFTACGDDISRNFEPLHGYEPSARAAARQVEDAWFKAAKGTRYDSSREAIGIEGAGMAFILDPIPGDAPF